MKIEPNMLCRVVGGEFPENQNAIIRTVERADAESWLCESLQPMSWWRTARCNGAYVWSDKVNMPAGHRGTISSSFLRPLYDGDADDESLAWASVPGERVGEPA